MRPAPQKALLVLHSGCRCEFLHRSPLFVGQRLGNSHVHLDDQVPNTLPFLDTVSANAKLRATLCTRWDPEMHLLTVYGFHSHLGAERSLDEIDRYGHMDVQPFTAEEFVRLDLEGDHQVPGFSAPAAAFTLAGQANFRSGFDTFRHRDLEAPILAHRSGPTTGLTR